MKEFLLYIWQLPQNLLGLLLLLIYKREKVYHKLNGRIFYHTYEMPSGISLGNYIIMSGVDLSTGMRHEYGHSIQSRYLGWLYLLVIGIPSLCGNLWDRLFHKKWKYSKAMLWYYNLPWEKWADRLGKVDRKEIIEHWRSLGL